MMNSNIVAGSNVFLSREDDPRRDSEFVSQIVDYERLKEIVERSKVDRQVPRLSEKQMSIVHRGIRCVFAKNDPCMGYVEGKGNQCKCINVNCPGIYDRNSFHGTAPWKGCNPGVTEAYIKEWTPDPKEKERYGDPEGLLRYYIVDMISDEEMSRYISNPQNEGFEYEIHRNPVPQDKSVKKENDRKYKVDPETGKKMVVVGYRLVITDNASYESDELIPIWGFVEEVEEKIEEVFTRKKAKRIEKKQDTPPIRRKRLEGESTSRDLDYFRKEEYERAVASAVSGEIKLTDADQEIFGNGEETVILLDNPAELAFVSGTFLVNGIEHGIENEHPIRLSMIDDYPKFKNSKRVFISNTTLKSGCQEANVKAWKAIAERTELVRLNVAKREFYNFSYGDQKSRWTCRNMYGVTHVRVEKEDIYEVEPLSDGLYPVSLVDDNDTYMILKKNGELLGRLGSTFVEMIDALKNSEEISGPPANITGLSLYVHDGKKEFLGMGHLKFIEY